MDGTAVRVTVTRYPFPGFSRSLRSSLVCLQCIGRTRSRTHIWFARPEIASLSFDLLCETTAYSALNCGLVDQLRAASTRLDLLRMHERHHPSQVTTHGLDLV